MPQLDEATFHQLSERHRRELHVHCYRMLGNFEEAEDLVQETYLRAWRRRESFQGGPLMRAWLYRIATNACLDAMRQSKRRVASMNSFAEIPWIQPYPDHLLDEIAPSEEQPDVKVVAKETIELSYLAVIQLLPPRQRAVLILRDVIGLSAGEVAEALDSTPASVYSALQRAHKGVDERLPAQSQQATLRALGDDRLRVLVESHVDAWERGDVESLVSLLTDDVTLTMPPIPTWFRGRESVASFLAAWPLAHRRSWRMIPLRASGQIAFGAYSRDPERGVFTAHVIEVVTLRGDRISEIAAFMAPESFPAFGLPAEIAG
jgi:RNA polymerase sigma-70 factor, ECF subfamily